MASERLPTLCCKMLSSVYSGSNKSVIEKELAEATVLIWSIDWYSLRAAIVQSWLPLQATPRCNETLTEVLSNKPFDRTFWIIKNIHILINSMHLKTGFFLNLKVSIQHIVASGKNECILHFWRFQKYCTDGDLASSTSTPLNIVWACACACVQFYSMEGTGHFAWWFMFGWLLPACITMSLIIHLSLFCPLTLSLCLSIHWFVIPPPPVLSLWMW